MKGKLSNGFKFEVDIDVLDDMELIEDIAASENGQVSRLISAIERILGKEQKQALYESLRGENGRVSTEAVSNAIGEIMERVQEDSEGKNS